MFNVEGKELTCNEGKTKRSKILVSPQRGSILVSPECRSVSALHSPLAEERVRLWESGNDVDRDHELKEVLLVSPLYEKTSVRFSGIQLIPRTTKIEHSEQNQPLNPSVYVCGGGVSIVLFLSQFLLHHFTFI